MKDLHRQKIKETILSNCDLIFAMGHFTFNVMAIFVTTLAKTGGGQCTV